MRHPELGPRVMAFTISVAAILVLQVVAVLPAAADDGQINLSPTTGLPGSTVLISGEDFDDEETVRICWGSVGCSNLGHVSTDDDGNFSLTVIVPSQAAPGDHTLAACERDDCATAVFEVQSETTTSIPATTTTIAVTTTTPETTTTQLTTTTMESTTTSAAGPTPPPPTPPPTESGTADPAAGVPPAAAAPPETGADQDGGSEDLPEISGVTPTSSNSRPYLGIRSFPFSSDGLSTAGRDEENEPDPAIELLSGELAAGVDSSDSKAATADSPEGFDWTVLEALLLGLAVMSTFGVLALLFVHGKRSSV